MAEERTLGLARAPQRSEEDESIEQLQRRMELARDSISNTVTEIKETVANQVQAVRDTLDWREQFKRRPVAWSLGAMGVGFLTGYGIAGAFKGDADEDIRSYGAYAGNQSLRVSAAPPQQTSYAAQSGSDEGPGLMDKLVQSSAYESLSREVGSIGSKLVEELSSTAKAVVIPLAITKLKQWVGLDRFESSDAQKSSAATSTATRAPRTDWSESRSSKPDSATLGHS